MLVLARKAGESIRIGDDVVLTVLHIGRGRVQIGIAAPREVPIRREELTTPHADWSRSPSSSGSPSLMRDWEVAVG